MSRALIVARSAVLLLALLPTRVLAAAGDDFAGWSDREVNAALASTQLAPPDPVPCPAIAATDVAGAIDCEVNKALSVRSAAPAP